MPVDFLTSFLTFSRSMPSIHKRARSPFWFVSFQDALGRWIKKSSKTTDRALALKIAVEWSRAAEQGRAGRLVETQARRVVSEIHEQATGDAMSFYTCKEWFEEWLAGKAGVTGERTLLKYKQVARDFLSHLAERAAQPLNAIASRDVRGFRDALAKRGQAPSTVNLSALKILSAPFTAALRMGYISVNPCAGVEALKDAADTEKDVFTPAQITALCDAAEGDWKGVILAGYFTGLRLKDITELRWEAIDLTEGLLCLRTSKTGARVTIPLAAEFNRWLSQQPLGIGKAPVFPSLAGKSGAGKSGLSMQFARIMAKAGIRGRALRQRQEDGAGRTQSSLTFHSLRHSFNSALANAGVSQEVRQKLTGHTSAKMNTKYTHLEIEGLRAAVGLLPALGNGTKP
jgi:integrase